MAFDFPNISPIAIDIFGLQIRWYALAYMTGLFGGLYYAKYLHRKFAKISGASFESERLDDLMFYVAMGVILGGRLGYVFFYKAAYYLQNPAEILHIWQGGMSFHGGLLGVMLAVFLFSRKFKIPLLTLGDFVAPTVSIGLFFGRITNFINAELYGRVTHSSLGVRFPHPYTGMLMPPRHASQLYEAFTEGLLLWCILWFFIHKKDSFAWRGQNIGIFLIGYGISRIFCEFFREPDSFLGFIMTVKGVHLTQGMILSLPMILVGLGFYRYTKKN